MHTRAGNRSVGRTAALLVTEVEEILASGSSGAHPAARHEASDLVAAVMRQPRWWPTLRCDDEISAGDEAAVRAAAQRLKSGMPFAYAVGHADFRQLNLLVDERVLIPRPETELLVEIVLHSPQGRSGGVASDVGTGSGAIALALASEGPFDRVIATDLSLDALEVARQNVRRCSQQLRAPLELRQGDALAPLAGEQVDVLVSNPPYIAFSELDDLPSSVRDWEPPTALVCPDDGLAVTRALVHGAGRVMRHGALLAMEVDARRARRVAAMVRECAGFDGVAVHRDLTGRDRFVTATWTGSDGRC